ncbi:MAG: helix-turn-helix transcriptional regulator [Sphingomonadaceae bacterium]|nr:helix-turn-helix transcriptional regulator [Sphingomonadaceae bacterium]
MPENRINKLTQRQRECLRLVLTGRGAKEIGGALGISPQTVEAHLKAARKLLGVGDSGLAARMLGAHEQTTTQNLGTQSEPLPEGQLGGQHAAHQHGIEHQSDNQPVLLREYRQPFDAPREPPASRDWVIRRRGQRHNELNRKHRLIAIGAITLALTIDAALFVLAAVSLMHFLIEVSRHGG